MMERDYFSRIEEYKRAFTDSLGNSGKEKVFMPSPTLLAAAFADEEFGRELAKDIKSKITYDGAAETILTADFASAVNAVRKAAAVFSDNANMFTEIRTLNVFAVGDAERFDEGFDEFCRAIGEAWNGAARVYVVCMADEMTPSGKKSAYEAMARFEGQLDKSCVFVMGRTKQNGRVDGRSEAREAQRKIIRDLVLNVRKLKLNCGAYSAGRASFEDCAGEFWTEALGKCKITADSTEQSRGIDEITARINECIKNGYKNEFAPADLSRVLRNPVSVSFGNGNDEECVRKLYGDSLDVYLRHERRRADKAVQTVAAEVKRIIADANGRTKLRLQQYIEERLGRESGAETRADTYTNILGEESSNVVRKAYEKYLYGKIRELKAEYMNKALTAALNIVADDAREYREAAERFDEERQSTEAYVTNCMKTTQNLGGDIPQITLKMPSADYIGGICGTLGARLADGAHYERYVERTPQSAAAWLIAEAEPYCINNLFNMSKRYYLVGKGVETQKVAASDNSFTPIEETYDDFDFALNVSSINLAEYRAFLAR